MRMNTLTNVARPPEERKYTLREFRTVSSVVAIEGRELCNIAAKKERLCKESVREGELIRHSEKTIFIIYQIYKILNQFM